jgi:hypothetical protein
VGIIETWLFHTAKNCLKINTTSLERWLKTSCGGSYDIPFLEVAVDTKHDGDMGRPADAEGTDIEVLHYTCLSDETVRHVDQIPPTTSKITTMAGCWPVKKK